MKLYDLPRNTKFKLTGNDWGEGEEFLLDHIDGMYSVCYKEGEFEEDGSPAIYHIAAFAEVEKVK